MYGIDMSFNKSRDFDLSTPYIWGTSLKNVNDFYCVVESIRHTTRYRAMSKQQVTVRGERLQFKQAYPEKDDIEKKNREISTNKVARPEASGEFYAILLVHISMLRLMHLPHDHALPQLGLQKH